MKDTPYLECVTYLEGLMIIIKGMHTRANDDTVNMNIGILTDIQNNIGKLIGRLESLN
jgi:hypothetical protein